VKGMNYIERLKASALLTGNIVCMGMDPVIEKIPLSKSPGDSITKFFTDILVAMQSESLKPAIVKPNYAFYAQYGFEGLRALKDVIEIYKKAGIMVLLDYKRGDIGTTSAAYAREAFDFWGADAVTIAPYMGSDSVGPFIEWCDKGKGVYILNRTSNKGAVDLQNLESSGKPIYMHTAQKIVEWSKPGTGAVVGATYPAELETISDFYVKSGKQIPLLIPGVGSQGGSAGDVVAALKKTKNPLWLHRINSSSGITYAYEKQKMDDYAGAAVREIRKLIGEIGKV
jgi:orotidine-5'-phosphate decarboxylase